MIRGSFCGRLQNQTAESAPCCATLSQQRAMSDNSNSTGSSGSSTNSWTLLSPEVRHPTRLGTALPALFHNKDDLEDYFLCVCYLLEMHRVSACRSCFPTMMLLFPTWIIQLEFTCVNCVFSQIARGTYLSFFCDPLCVLRTWHCANVFTLCFLYLFEVTPVICRSTLYFFYTHYKLKGNLCSWRKC